MRSASAETGLRSFGSLASTSVVTTIVFPIPTSSASQPPRTAAPCELRPTLSAAVDFSTSSMNASDCFWYGRSTVPSTRPAGSATSTGYTCSAALRISSQLHRFTATRRAWPTTTGFDDDEPSPLAAAGAAAAPPLRSACFCARRAAQWPSVCVALQCAFHSVHVLAGASQT